MCCQNEPGYEHHGEHHRDCGCGGHGGESGGMHHGGGCCCCGCGCGCHHGGGIHHGPDFGLFGHRRFISKEEVITHLEEYLKQLKAEATGVEEHIAELKKEQEA